MQEDTKKSVQTLLNNSHNETFNMQEVIAYGYDSSTGTVRALAVDSSGSLQVFSPTSTTIVTSGSIKTVTDTDGVKTKTTTIDSTDPNNKTITVVWS